MSHRDKRKAEGARQDSSLERSLLASIVTDPGHLPELLAAFAVRRMGPAVPRVVEQLRHHHPDVTDVELRGLVIARGRRAVVSEGSLVGGPFIVLIPVAFCVALLRQARTVLELAALDGRDPTASARAEELLVLQGVYEDTRQARDALARTPRAADAPGRWRRWAALWDVTLRMARLLGVLAPGEGGEDAGGRVRRFAVQAWRWLLLGLVLLVGFVAPLVWLPYMAMSYQRADARLARRVQTYYFGHPAPAARRRRISRPQPEVIAAAVRALVSLLVPLALTAVTFLAGLRIADSHWPVLAIVLAAGSAGVAGLWYRRHHGRRASSAG
ncbi:hypothetical protein [Streptomyces sp. NPDC003635]